MNRTFAFACALALCISALPAAGQSQGMGGMDMKGMEKKDTKKGKSQTHKASGTVTKVEPDKGTVTIAHGPVQSMNWSAMTMTFKAKDKKMLQEVSPGKKVEFDFVQQGKDYVITSVK